MLTIQCFLPLQSIAESIKKGQMKTHSRTPSNASSTSAEVARLTGSEPDAETTSLENVPLQEDPASGWQDVSAGPSKYSKSLYFCCYSHTMLIINSKPCEYQNILWSQSSFISGANSCTRG